MPIRTDTDEKSPTISWKDNPVTDPRRISPDWPRWAVVCGVQRPSDGRALVCVDADGPSGVLKAYSMFPGAVRVQTGRGEHAWVTLGPDAPDSVRSRFYIGKELDWRAGNCYALLPGSLYRPVSDPEITYQLLEGEGVCSATGIPDPVLKMIQRKSAPKTPPRKRNGSEGLGGSEIRTDPESAFMRVLTACAESGREVKRTRQDRAMVSCPTSRHPHGNRRPALYVTAKPGGVTLHCFAQDCPTVDVVEALGLTFYDLYDENSATEISVTEDSRTIHITMLSLIHI